MDLHAAFPSDYGALCALAVLLGVRHGLDADHLAAIDSLTRLAATRRRWYAATCGGLFSLGHGVIVVIIAVTVASIDGVWHLPNWLRDAGAWISTTVLMLLGATNLRAALTSRADKIVVLVAPKGMLYGRLLNAASPPAVMAIGALFAISFDTLTQAALFGAMGLQFGSVHDAAFLGVCFAFGMVVVDALDGWWIAHLIESTGRRSALASRLFALLVSTLSLAIGTLGALKLLSPRIEDWSDRQGVWVGLCLTALIALGYLAIRQLTRGRVPDLT